MGRASLLLLAGTAEATELAGRLVAAGEIDVLASLAGRTRSPAPLPCPVRTGGFGGVDGLAAELQRGRFSLVVDATHPFADEMPYHAAAAAARVGLPRLRLVRPPWLPEPGDVWHPVPDLVAAVECLEALGARRVLLTVGRQELALFAAAASAGIGFVVRSIDPPPADVLPRATVVLARPPFTVASEAALLRDHAVDAVVSRNSGGAVTAPKLAAARAAAVPVVMVERPPVPAGPTAATVDEALAWVAATVS